MPQRLLLPAARFPPVSAGEPEVTLQLPRVVCATHCWPLMGKRRQRSVLRANHTPHQRALPQALVQLRRLQLWRNLALQGYHRTAALLEQQQEATVKLCAMLMRVLDQASGSARGALGMAEQHASRAVCSARCRVGGPPASNTFHAAKHALAAVLRQALHTLIVFPSWPVSAHLPPVLQPAGQTAEPLFSSLCGTGSEPGLLDKLVQHCHAAVPAVMLECAELLKLRVRGWVGARINAAPLQAQGWPGLLRSVRALALAFAAGVWLPCGCFATTACSRSVPSPVPSMARSSGCGTA